MITIGIACYNNLEYTKKCIESIKKYTKEPYQLLVVDDASTDGTFEYLNTLDCTIIKHDNNLGWVIACNDIIGNTDTEFLVLMNNDVEVTEGWLTAMLKTMNKRKDIGIVGCKHIDPKSGFMIHAGGYIDYIHPKCRGYMKNNSVFYNIELECQLISFACVLFRTEVFKTGMRFDTSYLSPGGYDDADMSIQVRELGYKLYYCPNSVIYHHGFVTRGKDHDMMTICDVINLSYFLSKWKEKIVHDTDLMENVDYE